MPWMRNFTATKISRYKVWGHNYNHSTRGHINIRSTVNICTANMSTCTATHIVLCHCGTADIFCLYVVLVSVWSIYHVLGTITCLVQYCHSCLWHSWWYCTTLLRLRIQSVPCAGSFCQDILAWCWVPIFKLKLCSAAVAIRPVNWGL